MDISDELFDVRPSCSTSTSLNVTGTRDLMQDPVQEKDSNSILIKNIAVKLTRLQSAKEERIKKILKSKRRNRWRHGLLNGKFSKKKKKKVLSSKSSSSQQAFRNAKPDTETISSEDRGNEQINTYLHNQLCHEEVYEDAQQNEQRVSNVAQNKTETFNLSTCKTKKEDLYVTYACSRTLPYKFYRKNIIPSSASAIDYCDSLSSSSKDTESSLHSNQSNLIDYLSHKNTKVTNTLIRLRLKLMAKKMKKRLNEWKFKRKSAYSDKYSSDSETEEQRVPNKKCRRIVFIEESDSENETVNNTTTIKDNNRSESHLSVEKIDTKKTCIQFSSPAKVILTKLEKMEDEDVIKWRNSKIKPSDIASESEEQLERRKLSRNLVASDSQDKLILPTADWFSETQDISKDSPLINSYTDKRRYAERLKLNKLRKKYKLFKKPRVLLIKLDTLQCSSKDGRYSATEVECLTKEYLNFVINSISKSKPHELTYKYLRLQSIMDANITCMKGHSINSSLSREQSMNESFKCFIEENSIKGTTLSLK